MSITRTTDCLVLANAAAGSVTPALLSAVHAWCARRWTPAVRLTEAAGEGAKAIAEALAAPQDSWPEVIVVAGGDGTAREAAEGLARALGRWPDGWDGSPAPAPALLLLPAGTGSSSARALWGDTGWESVLTSVEDGAVGRRDLDLIRLAEADAGVLLGASTGLIAQVTEAALHLRGISGRERYLQALGHVLADPQPYQGRVTVDGTLVHAGSTTMVTVGGARHRVGTLEVLPLSIMDDGLLDVCVVDGDLDE